MGIQASYYEWPYSYGYTTTGTATMPLPNITYWPAAAPPVRQGWQCPACSIVLAPHVNSHTCGEKSAEDSSGRDVMDMLYKAAVHYREVTEEPPATEASSEDEDRNT